MTRPQIIRADTIDLQDQKAPSAQDHTRQPTHPAALGAGPAAPHQAETLREIAAEATEEQHRSPRLSGDWGEDNQYGNNGISATTSSTLTGANLQQQDALAVAQNGGHTGSTAEDADMADAEGDDGMDDDDMMDKISSSPSIDDEDIDFEFVYALHTFIATVEGQANATKGDTMVLLDDSNSYWWLVRVVKDGTIGYLPAEHIETPTERLARLNKHRNIDLSATMLGDQADKPKNPLKKAIRRRNAKTVTFAPPTYVEASDNDYSSDEDEGEALFYAQQQQAEVQQADPEEEEESAKVEPLSVRAGVRDVKSDDSTSTVTAKNSTDISRTSEDTSDGKPESKSRNGTVRNTDSFFKDDSVETRKITITPNLLRDDSSTSTIRTSNDSKELRQRPSLDRLEKEASSDKSKDDKKKKDKKSGMLSGLFKRKDKKAKLQEEDIDDLIYGKKGSSEDARASPVESKELETSAPAEEPTVATRGQSPQRQPSKLHKQPREIIPIMKQQNVSLDAKTPEPQQQAPAPDRPPPAINSLEPSLRLVQPEIQPTETPAKQQQQRVVSPELSRNPAPQQVVQEESKSGGTFSKILRSRSNSEAKPEKVKKAKARVELDDFDSSTEESPIEAPAKEPLKRPMPGGFPDSYISTPGNEKANDFENSTNIERLSESPVHVSPIDVSRSNPPALMVDTSSQDGPPSPGSSPSPELIDAAEARGEKPSERSLSTSTSATWSDAHLRTFFDDDSDIKDLLVVVYDKSGVVPAGPDHPITGQLFKEENAKLADITNRLDGMLGDWLARKQSAASR